MSGAVNPHPVYPEGCDGVNKSGQAHAIVPLNTRSRVVGVDEDAFVTPHHEVAEKLAALEKMVHDLRTRIEGVDDHVEARALFSAEWDDDDVKCVTSSGFLPVVSTASHMFDVAFDVMCDVIECARGLYLLPTSVIADAADRSRSTLYRTFLRDTRRIDASDETSGRRTGGWSGVDAREYISEVRAYYGFGEGRAVQRRHDDVTG